MMIEGPELVPGTVVKQRPADGSEWRFDGRRLEGVRFERIKDGWDWLTFRDCTFADCEFVGCVLDWQLGSTIPDPRAASNFERCVFTRCDLSRIGVRHVLFADCTFESCDWEPLHLRSTDLVRNRFVGVVRGLSLWGRDDSRPRPNEIRGNDFTEADLQGLGLNAEVPVDDQLWPSGDNYVRLDRKPERMQALRRRLESDGDSLGLLGWLEASEIDLRPEVLQSIDVLRLDDPSMPESTLRAYHALADVVLEH